MQSVTKKNIEDGDYIVSLRQGIKSAKHRAQLAFDIIVSSQLEKNANIVDIGFGMGLLLKSLEDADYCNLFGVDNSKKAVAEFKNQTNTAQLYCLDIGTNSLPFDDNMADIVICMEVFEHLFDPVNALNEITRILRPGGMAIFSFPNEYRLKRRIRFALGKSISSPLKVGGHIKLFNQELAKQFVNIYLSVEQIKALGEKRMPDVALKIAPTLFAKWFLVMAKKK